jgi:hypothetical protein
MSVKVLLILGLCPVFSFASELGVSHAPRTGVAAASSAQSARNFEIIEHPKCNEVRLKDQEKPQRSSWATSTNAPSKFSDSRWAGLKEGTIADVPFGHDYQTISYQLSGKSLEPGALNKSGLFQLETQNLYEGPSDRIVGKANVFRDRDDVAGFVDEHGQANSRILLAILYVNHHADTVPQKVTCKYQSGDPDLVSADSAGCIWIDKDSRGSNGLPFCW